MTQISRGQRCQGFEEINSKHRFWSSETRTPLRSRKSLAARDSEPRSEQRDRQQAAAGRGGRAEQPGGYGNEDPGAHERQAGPADVKAK